MKIKSEDMISFNFTINSDKYEDIDYPEHTELFNVVSRKDILTLKMSIKVRGSCKFHIDEDFFEGFENLQTLYIESLDSKSEIVLHKDIFQPFKDSIRRLYICHLRIGNLDETIFRKLYELQELYIYKTMMMSVSPSIFEDLTSLKVLYLFSNKFRYLPKNIFINLLSIENIDISNNQFEDDNCINGVFQSNDILKGGYIDGCHWYSTKPVDNRQYLSDDDDIKPEEYNFQNLDED